MTTASAPSTISAAVRSPSLVQPSKFLLTRPDGRKPSIYEQREAIVNTLALRPGMVVADVGRVPASVVDLVFTSDIYHHFEYPQAMLASIHAALKRGGPWVLSHVRANRETVIAEVTAAGFVLERTHNLLRQNYFLEFRKP